MAHSSPDTAAPASKAWWRLTLTQQILLGLVVGSLTGWFMNAHPTGTAAWGDWLKLVREIFLHLIKAMIAPLVFASVVQGIAGTGDMKKVGRIGAKALLYFEV